MLTSTFRSVQILLFALTLSIAVNAQNDRPFETLKRDVKTFWAQGDYSKSIELLLKNEDHYLEDSDQHTIIYYLGLLYLEIDDYKKSFGILTKGFKQRFFFSFWPNHRLKIFNHPEGKAIIQWNEENRAAYQKKSTAKYEIIFPKKYDPKLEYPLLYFLHGNNSNLENLRIRWRNISLPMDLIVLLAQSPHPRSNYTFDWVDSTSSRNSMQNMHIELSSSLSIDSTKIIMGGFSNGGRMAIDLFLDQTIPTMGFVVFNPSRPKTKITLHKKGSLSGRGAIITGEKDYMLSKQIKMANIFFDLSFPLRLVVYPDHGHDYHERFADELESSIEFLLENSN